MESGREGFFHHLSKVNRKHCRAEEDESRDGRCKEKREKSEKQQGGGVFVFLSLYTRREKLSSNERNNLAKVETRMQVKNAEKQENVEKIMR